MLGNSEEQQRLQSTDVWVTCRIPDTAQTKPLQTLPCWEHHLSACLSLSIFPQLSFE